MDGFRETNSGTRDSDAEAGRCGQPRHALVLLDGDVPAGCRALLDARSPYFSRDRAGRRRLGCRARVGLADRYRCRAANRLGGTLSSDVRLRSLHDRARASGEFRQPWNGSRRADQPDRPEFIVMTRSLRIVLACAIALLVIGMGGLAALMLIPSPPQTTKSMIGALGGPFTLTATDGRAVTEQTYRGK